MKVKYTRFDPTAFNLQCNQELRNQRIVYAQKTCGCIFDKKDIWNSGAFESNCQVCYVHECKCVHCAFTELGQIIYLRLSSFLCILDKKKLLPGLQQIFLSNCINLWTTYTDNDFQWHKRMYREKFGAPREKIYSNISFCWKHFSSFHLKCTQCVQFAILYIALYY